MYFFLFFVFFLVSEFTANALCCSAKEGDAVPLKEMPSVQSPEPQCSPLEDGGPPSSTETPGQGKQAYSSQYRHEFHSGETRALKKRLVVSFQCAPLGGSADLCTLHWWLFSSSVFHKAVAVSFLYIPPGVSAVLRAIPFLRYSTLLAVSFRCVPLGGSTELWTEVQRLLDALDSSINSRRARAVPCTFQDSDSHIEHLTAAWETWVHVTQVRRIKDSAVCLIASITMIPGVNRELKRDFHMLVLSSALPAPSICAHRSHYVLEIDLEPNK